MARRTQLHRIMPWVGGINTSVDPGVLDTQELVQADNVQFSTTGARIKREALIYLDNSIAAPDFRSSSGFIRTLVWTTTPIYVASPLDQRLVVGEMIQVTGNTHYNVTSASILSVSPVSGGYAITYDAGASFSEAQTAAAGAVLTRASSVIMCQDYWRFNGEENVQLFVYATDNFQLFTLDAEGRRVQILGQPQTTQLAVNPGAQITTGDSFNLNAGNNADLWYVWYNVASGGGNPSPPGRTGIEVDLTGSETDLQVATKTAAAFSGNPDFTAVTNVAPIQKVQITTVADSSGSLASKYLPVTSTSTLIQYYLWFKVSGTGSDPDLPGQTGVEVDIATNDTADTVAAATAAALADIANTGVFTATTPGSSDIVIVEPVTPLPPMLPPGSTITVGAGNTGFTVSPFTAGVLITAKAPGITDETVDFNTGFVFTTTAFGATATVSTLETIRTLVFNERLEIYLSGIGNFPIIYNPDENANYQLMGTNYAAAGGLSMPDASFAFQFLSRVWTNEKSTDNLHYCETFNETKWLGIGDSGFLPVAQGDGDPEGVVNAYVYKGLVIIGKKDSRHRLEGDSPENFIIQRISSGMGNEGQMAIPVDEMDVIFMSSRGIHSQAVTDQYGETNAMYLSADIKPTFNTWQQSARKFTQGSYIPELNSVAFAITEAGNETQNAVWLYNIEVQTPGKPKPGAWYRWPDISCTALTRVFTSDIHKLTFGTAYGRVIQAQNTGNFSDFGVDSIPFTVQTGTIYPGNDPQVMKAFHRITLIYRPTGNFSFAVTAKIDNQQTQGFSFNQLSGLDLLGETFILGTSILGASNTLAPFTFQMEGYGRGVTLTVSQDNPSQQIQIWGFTLEYEPIGLEQDVE